MSLLLKFGGTCITPTITWLLRSGIFSRPYSRIAVMDTLTVNPSTGKRRVDEHSEDDSEVLHKRNRCLDPGTVAMPVDTQSKYITEKRKKIFLN